MAHGNSVENELFWSGFAGNWEGESLRLWRDLCAGAETVLDVGANTGVYALAASSVSPMAQVVAFEPVKRVFDRLAENAVLNGGRITVVNAAASDREGVATLHDTDGDHVYSASLEYEMMGRRYTRAYEVPALTLDAFCAAEGIGRVDLVKIDVERHEPAVFRGFQATLAASRPDILVEILDEEIGSAVSKAVSGLGYSAYAVNDHGPDAGLHPVRRLGTVERNYLLCQPKNASRLGLAAPVPLG